MGTCTLQSIQLTLTEPIWKAIVQANTLLYRSTIHGFCTKRTETASEKQNQRQRYLEEH